ncbi:LysE family translocator [Devosia sediminis]|uniref:LysE family transporter n=1 Tax=Devosia sediminis TaxID=2798801 RepID=A0A934IWI9_9HYPH|nr:LysE family transporter [Devosia sediminis]MBJ3783515.1 LysE family transporter [Devosia sediminis]
MLQTFLIVWLGVAAAQASPGPNMFAVAGVALSTGRRDALMVVMGIATGSLLWSLFCALGMGALFTAVPALLTLLKFVGGFYLLYMGWKALRTAARGVDANIRATRPSASALAAWRRGLLVVMTNPKAVLMWLAITTFLYGAGLGGAQVLLFGPIVATSAILIYGFYAWLFSTRTATSGYARYWRWIEAVFGAAFGAFGLVLVGSGLRDLRP